MKKQMQKEIVDQFQLHLYKVQPSCFCSFFHHYSIWSSFYSFSFYLCPVFLSLVLRWQNLSIPTLPLPISNLSIAPEVSWFLAMEHSKLLSSIPVLNKLIFIYVLSMLNPIPLSGLQMVMHLFQLQESWGWPRMVLVLLKKMAVLNGQLHH